MKPEPSKCPVTGKTYAEQPSKCPIQKLFAWCKWRVSSMVPTLPFREKNDAFESLIQASVAFSDILLSHESHVTQRLIEQSNLYFGEGRPKQRMRAFEKLFVEYSTKFNSLLCEDFLLIFREIQIDNRPEFLDACHGDETTYFRLSNAYQIGMKIIYDIWRDIYRAFVTRYGRAPTPDELKKFESFVISYSKNIAQHPAIFSVPIREIMVRVQSYPHLFFDDSDTLQFDDKKLKFMQTKAHNEFSQHSEEKLKQILTNHYCPALPRIPKIAQMCCNVFRATYEHVYHQYKE